MMWPLNLLFKPAQDRIAKAEVATAEARTKRYQAIFDFDTMIRDHLILMEPKHNEPPDQRG